MTTWENEHRYNLIVAAGTQRRMIMVLCFVFVSYVCKKNTVFNEGLLTQTH